MRKCRFNVSNTVSVPWMYWKHCQVFLILPCLAIVWRLTALSWIVSPILLVCIAIPKEYIARWHSTSTHQSIHPFSKQNKQIYKQSSTNSTSQDFLSHTSLHREKGTRKYHTSGNKSTQEDYHSKENQPCTRSREKITHQVKRKDKNDDH